MDGGGMGFSHSQSASKSAGGRSKATMMLQRAAQGRRKNKSRRHKALGPKSKWRR
jgi:hypothetical protein